MPAITKEFLDSLPEKDILIIRDYIWNRFGTGPAVHETVPPQVSESDKKDVSQNDSFKPHCPVCGSMHIVKNGTCCGTQRYLCKDCRKTFSSTSGTIMASSKIPVKKTLEMIECEIEGLSLKETSYRSKLSESTCFNFRQRLYSMASTIIEDVQLADQIELDSTYSKINLSGTRPKDMPRFSKRRGKKSPVVGEFQSLRGLSHHKICIVTGIDENDNILYRVSGLGMESFDKYEQHSSHFTDGKTIISDDNSSIQAFAKAHDMKSEVIPSKRHTTEEGNSLGDVNQLHQTLKDLVRSKHGVSTRHLPGYLNWISYLKRLIYSIPREQIPEQILSDLYETEARFLRDDICKAEQPVSLYEAYGEYHYGIFSDTNV